MNITPITNLNLELTLLSGQTFSWQKIGNWFYGSFRDKIVKIKQEGDNLIWQTYPQKDDYEFIIDYFGLDQDYSQAIKEIQIDEHLIKATEKYKGLRILNQDFEQTLFSFLLAQNKNIKAIRQSIEILKRQYGKKISVEAFDQTPVQDEDFYLFPSLEFYNDISLEDLTKARVGYRAKYLKDAANSLTMWRDSGVNPTGGDEDIVRSQLQSIHGIGNKVSDCIMVFSLGFHHITPIDVWGDKIIKDLYKNRRSKNYDQKRKWFTKKFGKNTALAGQFLFEYIRNYDPKNYY